MTNRSEIGNAELQRKQDQTPRVSDTREELRKVTPTPEVERLRW